MRRNVFDKELRVFINESMHILTLWYVREREHFLMYIGVWGVCLFFGWLVEFFSCCCYLVWFVFLFGLGFFYFPQP